MQYYSHVFNFHTSKPYDRPESRYTSWLGNFVKPLRETGLCGRYWFTCYGDHVKFRAYTDRHAELLPHVERLAPACGLTRRDVEKELTLVEDLVASRFLARGRQGVTEESRALLVLSYLHSVAELIVDQLVSVEDGYWRLEENTDHQNPNGSGFESLHHLFCLMTGVPVSILVIEQGDSPSLYGTFWGKGIKGQQRRRWSADGTEYTGTELFLTY